MKQLFISASSLTAMFLVALFSQPTISFSHSGGLNSQGCHAGSQPYHCHRAPNSSEVRTPSSSQPKQTTSGKIVSGIITHVRDGDTIEVDGIAIRLAALKCPENGTSDGNYATVVAKKFQGTKAICELTGAKTYDRLVGYCTVNKMDFGRFMMENASCDMWEKYDVWNRY